MSQTNQALRIVAESPADEPTWVTELEELLGRAAKLSADNGLPADKFMSAAWQATLAANPDVRDELEDKELRVQLKKLRRLGLIGQA